MNESSLAIGIVVNGPFGLVPVRGRIARSSPRLTSGSSTRSQITPIRPLERDDVSSEPVTTAVYLDPPSMGWLSRLDPAALYQFYASLGSLTLRPALSMYA